MDVSFSCVYERMLIVLFWLLEQNNIFSGSIFGVKTRKFFMDCSENKSECISVDKVE